MSCPRRDAAAGPRALRLLCNERGGVVDDVTVYRLAEDRLFLCVNAANIEKDYRWIARHTPAGVELRDRSDETGLLALQGPASAAVLGRVAATPTLARAAPLRVRAAPSSAGAAALVSRTGYTGSDGFELYCGARDAVPLWDALLEAGAAHGLVPAGLGARDTLRLEAALPLYGHELDDETLAARGGPRPLREARRGPASSAARRSCGAATRGPPRSCLVGFELAGARHRARRARARARGREVGGVTSGAPSPTLGKSIGLGYVPPALAEPGTRLEVMVRGRAVAARVVETPFVRGPGAGRSSEVASQWPTTTFPGSCATRARTSGCASRASAWSSASPTTRSNSSATSCSSSCPRSGARVERGEPFGVVESVKAVADLFAPVTGRGRRGRTRRSPSSPSW